MAAYNVRGAATNLRRFFYCGRFCEWARECCILWVELGMVDGRGGAIHREAEAGSRKEEEGAGRGREEGKQRGRIIGRRAGRSKREGGGTKWNALGLRGMKIYFWINMVIIIKTNS